MAILFILVIFPLKFPLKPKKSTHMGRKGRRAKTKTVLKPVNQGAKLGNMKNKNHPNTIYALDMVMAMVGLNIITMVNIITMILMIIASANKFLGFVSLPI